MRELSLHILDIVENGIDAGADCIHTLVKEAPTEDLLTIKVLDNGRGMPDAKIANPADPFITERGTRRVGMGLSLLAAAAERCGGGLRVETRPGGGTQVEAVFRYSHIDRAPLGNMAATIAALIAGNPQIDFIYTHIVEDANFTLDTRELKKEVGIDSLTDYRVVYQLTASIRKSLGRVASGRGRQTRKPAR